MVLLEKHESIMDDITTVCHQYINDRRSDNTLLDIPTIDEFDIKLNAHRSLFKSQDAVYAHLRLIKPSETEMLETRHRISIMKKLWIAMGLSITPKAHLIFEHAADNQRRFGGIGDKIEDPLEKRHQ